MGRTGRSRELDERYCCRRLFCVPKFISRVRWEIILCLCYPARLVLHLLQVYARLALSICAPTLLPNVPPIAAPESAPIIPPMAAPAAVPMTGINAVPSAAPVAAPVTAPPYPAAAPPAVPMTVPAVSPVLDSFTCSLLPQMWHLGVISDDMHISFLERFIDSPVAAGLTELAGLHFRFETTVCFVV